MKAEFLGSEELIFTVIFLWINILLSSLKDLAEPFTENLSKYFVYPLGPRMQAFIFSTK